MFDLDDALYLQRILKHGNNIDQLIFYFLFSVNKDYVIDICNELKEEIDNSDIDIEYLYCIGLHALERSIMEFDYMKNDIDDYYHDYIKNFISNELERLSEDLPIIYIIKDYDDFIWILDEGCNNHYLLTEATINEFRNESEQKKRLVDIYRASIHEDEYYINILKEKFEK